MPKLMFSNEPKTFINKTKQIGFGLDSPIHPQKIKNKTLGDLNVDIENSY